MTPEQYFKQRLSPNDFIERGYTTDHGMHPPIDGIYGKKVSMGFGITISYTQDDGFSALSIDIHELMVGGSWQKRCILDRMEVYCPAELDFMLNRLPRFLFDGNRKDYLPMLPECPLGIEIWTYHDDGRPSTMRMGCIGPISVWGSGFSIPPVGDNGGRIEAGEPWGVKLPLEGFETLYSPVEGEYATSSVTARIIIPSQRPRTIVNNDSIDMSTEIKAGDLVVLKSGGPTMTVGQLIPPGSELYSAVDERLSVLNSTLRAGTELADCFWFEDASPMHVGDQKAWGRLQSKAFPAEVLKKIE